MVSVAKDNLSVSINPLSGVTSTLSAPHPTPTPVQPLCSIWTPTPFKKTQADSTQSPMCLGGFFVAPNPRFCLLTWRGERIQDPEEYPHKCNPEVNIWTMVEQRLQNIFSSSFPQRDCPEKQSSQQPLGRPSLKTEKSVMLRTRQ